MLNNNTLERNKAEKIINKNLYEDLLNINDMYKNELRLLNDKLNVADDNIKKICEKINYKNSNENIKNK